MDDELKRFMSDLVILLQEKYNDTLNSVEIDSKSDKAFKTGMNLAYYDALSIIESQLNSFGYDVLEIGNITPELSKEAKI